MKKIFKAFILSLFVITLFASCEYNKGEITALDEVVSDLTTAKVGYGFDIDSTNPPLKLTVKPADDGGTTGRYTQAAVAIPANMKLVGKISVTFSNTGNAKIEFLKTGANPWEGAISGYVTYYDPATEERTVEITNLPKDAGFITFGSNGGNAGDIITISKIKYSEN